MNFKDIFTLFDGILALQPWQFGSYLKSYLKANQWVIITCFCGDKNSKESFKKVREVLYQMSSVEIQSGLCDLGELMAGKTIEDTQYILQEVLRPLFQMQCRVVFLSDNETLQYAFFSEVYRHRQNLRYVHFDAHLDFDTQIEISKIFEESFQIKEYIHAGYQRHWANPASVSFLKEVNFEAIKLSEIINEAHQIEPMLRFADVVTLNANVLEMMDKPMSDIFQINGLNRREICACMQNIGLGKKMIALGLFNFKLNGSWQNIQLLAQMLWYFFEGIGIQQNRPKKMSMEKYIVMVENEGYIFQREVFSNEWYFGESDDIINSIPCSYEEFEQAKKGKISQRLLRKM